MAARKQPSYTQSTGKRKTAIARVRVYAGEGIITVNKTPLEKYFGRETLRLCAAHPFEISGTAKKYDVIASLSGGGVSAQAEALRHGISRALIEINPDFRKTLKGAGYLTRDPREKERRKVGHRKARRTSQFSKR